jgi:hypothetical protein
MKYIIPIVVIAALIIYFFLPAGNVENASVEIEVMLNNLIKSGERKDLNVVMEYFSPDYKDSSERNYESVRTIIKSAFDRFDIIEGGYSNLSVSTTENKNGEPQTIANLDIWIRGGKEGSVYKLVGTEDNPENIDIGFESLMLGGWKILRIEGLD